MSRTFVVALAGLLCVAAVSEACFDSNCQTRVRVEQPRVRVVEQPRVRVVEQPRVRVEVVPITTRTTLCTSPSCYGQQATKQLATCVFQAPKCRPLIYKLCQTPQGARAASDAIAKAINGFAEAKSDAKADALYGDALALR